MASWGPFWGFLGGLLGASWDFLGASWGLLGASRAGRLEFSVRGPPLGPLLVPSWGPLGPSWAPLRPSWSPLGPSWGPLGSLLGRLEAVLGASWTMSNAVMAEKWYMLKMCVFLQEFEDFGLLGASWEGSWGVLATSGAVLGPFWASWSDLSASLGSLGPSWGFLGRPQGLSWSSRASPGGPDEFGGDPPPPNRPDRAPGGGVWRGGSISHADDPQGVGGLWPLANISSVYH